MRVEWQDADDVAADEAEEEDPNAEEEEDEGVWRLISNSARLAPSRIGPDPDGGWRFDLQLLFPQSEIVTSIAVIAGAMATQHLTGRLRLSPQQGDMDLTTRAE